MRQQLVLLKKFLSTFGLWNGLKLYFKFLLGRVENIKLPNIRYPFSLRFRTSDIPTFYQVFLDNEYNLNFNTLPKIIIDGGANIGLFAIKLKNDFPDAKIICVEPDPENFQMLQKNLSLYNEVFIENSGLWNKDTKLKVYDKYNYGKWGMIVEEDIHAGNIRATSVKSLMEKYAVENIDILKLDIETSEKQVFSEDYEIWLPKVKTIVIELHDWMEEGCSKPFFGAINKSFNKYKYSIKGENTVITNMDID